MKDRRIDDILNLLATGSGSYRFADLMFGISTHDLYHTGQIQLVKRLYRDRGK
jgi:hypothetical protein